MPEGALQAASVKPDGFQISVGVLTTQSPGSTAVMGFSSSKTTTLKRMTV